MRPTDTAQFRRWFGKSKVVDASGKPLVVYHGTNADFDAFDPDRAGENYGLDGEGFFFTDSLESAEHYAQDKADMKDEGEPRVVPVYFSLKNPLEADVESDPFFTPDGNPDRVFDGHREELLERMHEGGHGTFDRDNAVLRWSKRDASCPGDSVRREPPADARASRGRPEHLRRAQGAFLLAPGELAGPDLRRGKPGGIRREEGQKIAPVNGEPGDTSFDSTTGGVPPVIQGSPKNTSLPIREDARTIHNASLSVKKKARERRRKTGNQPQPGQDHQLSLNPPKKEPVRLL